MIEWQHCREIESDRFGNKAAESLAFVSIPAVKMAWIILKLLAKNAMPGRGWVSAAVDFTQAAYHLGHQNYVGALISTVSGVGEICTNGLSGSVKELVEESAKKFTMQAVKEMAQEETAKRLSKEIAQGLITESTEKVMKEGTKKATGWSLNLFFKFISTGGKNVKQGIADGYIQDALERVIPAMWKQSPKLAFDFAKFAEEGALKEFKKHTWKFIAKDGFFASVTGCINFFSY